MFYRICLSLILVSFLNSCINNNNKVKYEATQKTDNPFEIYKEGFEAFNINDFFYASQKFSEAELIFDSPKHAAKSSIMSAYSLYAINLYNDAEENLNRFLKNYPADKSVIYAHYLLAIIQFEQVGDEKHDLKPLIESKKRIDFFLKKYPNTEYAIDLKFKNSLLENQFAAKELYIAKYYISVQKWVPAINRLKKIVEDYEKTVFIEEALHRLVEIHYHLGLEQEAKEYAKILGYNYNSSEWFKKSYKVLNKDYKIISKKEIKNNDNFFSKIMQKIK